MTNEPHDDVKAIWQGQPVEPVTVSLAELRRRAQRFQRVVRWRNVREYAAAALVAAAFGYFFFRFHTPLVRTGAILSMAGALYVAYQLHRHGSARTLPVEMARRSYLDFHRHALERQRDLLRGVWGRYLLPLVPGLALFLVGLGVEQLKDRWLPVAAVGAVSALVFFLVARLNQSVARSLQHRIDGLQDLEREP